MDFRLALLILHRGSILLVGLLALLLLATIPTVANGEQNCNIEVADDCAHELYMYGSDATKFATSAREQRAKCKKNKDFEKCVKDYSIQCTKPHVRQYLNIMMSGPIQVSDEISFPLRTRKHTYTHASIII
jgi:hypothetical protein